MNTEPAFTIRPAARQDLDAINAVIEAAIMQWDIPERVKRLSLSSYFYNELDFDHLWIDIVVDQKNIIAVCAVEKQPQIVLSDQSGLLLHGLYVHPDCQRLGIGSMLLRHSMHYAQQQLADGLIIKAQKDAEPFYSALGMQKIPIEDIQRDFDKRYWLPVKA